MDSRELAVRQSYIEELAALEAQVEDASKAEIARERGRADTAEKRAARSDAERDQLRQQVERLLGEIDAHRKSWARANRSDDPLYSAADQVRKELGE